MDGDSSSSSVSLPDISPVKARRERFRFDKPKKAVSVKPSDHQDYSCPDCGRQGTPMQVLMKSCCKNEIKVVPKAERTNRFKTDEMALAKKKEKQERRDKELLEMEVREQSDCVRVFGRVGSCG
jgi:hypothetical protein